jgi:hypothetical protein
MQIERAIIAGTAFRTIAGQFGPSKTSLMRHRPHVVDSIAKSGEARSMVRANTLLQDVRAGEQRAESLYEQAQAILAAAMSNDDPRTALQAIRTASAVMSEARGYLELRGELTSELGRDRAMPTMSIQIINGAGPGELPRISFASQDAIEPAEDCIEEIGLRQLP